MSRELLKGRWLSGHILVVVMAAGFLALGFWQLARNHHKQELVRKDKAAYAAPAPELGAPPPPSGARVQARGIYDGAHQVLLRDQSRGDAIGVDVLTPLRLADGEAVLVDRGWVSSGAPTVAPPIAPPTAGTVVVRGVVNTPRSLSTQDSMTRVGPYTSVPRVDVASLRAAVPYALQPIWIEAQSQQPPPVAGSASPALPTPPAPDSVNHLEYAFEWFALALIPLIGWPIALVHFNRRKSAKQSTAAA
jgi:cytochrome oxidase assembly protein ShyY1